VVVLSRYVVHGFLDFTVVDSGTWFDDLTDGIFTLSNDLCGIGAEVVDMVIIA